MHMEAAEIKTSVVRGARACTVCRAAKMKCVASDDGSPQCQRCKRANADCVFEKHRRGRKPGSKLSEASKMLRRLEKGLNNAKLKSDEMAPPYPSTSHVQHENQEFTNAPPQHSPENSFNPSRHTHFPSYQLPPLQFPPAEYEARSHRSLRPLEMETEGGEERTPDMFHAKPNQEERPSFFRTILNADHDTALPSSTTSCSAGSNGRGSYPPPPLRPLPVVSGLSDPVSAGIMDEEAAKILFDAFYLRLNPFINLFDPSLHTIAYVRGKCPFLFTTILMVSSKFFKPEHHKQCLKLANEYAVRAFAEGWKRLEVVQAFACLCYWKEPDDNRTFTYIGYACRMAIELKLNRCVMVPSLLETEFGTRERRNRERTYLVLFVQDRVLSMQTGRAWMIPEDDMARQASSWHERSGADLRPEDVIVSAFIELQRIAAETMEIAQTNNGYTEVNFEVVLRNCNTRLAEWMDRWHRDLLRAPGSDKFHVTLLNFYRLHVRLFLNGLAIQSATVTSTRSNPDLKAVTACCSSGLETFEIVIKDLTSMGMLPYAPDVVSVMTAYSAVFLLKLVRNPLCASQLPHGMDLQIRNLVAATSKAYHDASALFAGSSTAVHNARFFNSLVTNDVFRPKDRDVIDPRLQSRMFSQLDPDPFSFPAASTVPPYPTPDSSQPPSQTSPPHGLDEIYWDIIFRELGFGTAEDLCSVEATGAPSPHINGSSGSMNGNIQSNNPYASQTLFTSPPPPPWHSPAQPLPPFTHTFAQAPPPPAPPPHHCPRYSDYPQPHREPSTYQ